MNAYAENFAAFNNAGINQFVKASEFAFAAIERNTRFALDSAKAFGADLSNDLQAISAAKDAQDLFALRGKLVDAKLEKTTATARAAYEEALAQQGAASKFAEGSAAELNKAFVSFVDSAAKAAPQGSEAFVQGFKNAFAASQAATETFSKAAKQAVSVAESNLKTASEAAVAATAKAKK